jgi:hypothetical protein
MESVYLETTLISYLVARPSRDILIAAHQQATRDWWAERIMGSEVYSKACLRNGRAQSPRLRHRLSISAPEPFVI